MKIYQFLEYTVEDRIATISLNRPDEGNALNDVIIVELRDAIMAAEQQLDVKVILLKGKGSAFCKGADLAYLKRMQSYNLEQNRADSTTLIQLLLTIYRSTKVVIAEVHGDAIGIGCGLVTVCDFAFVSPETQMGFPQVQNGFTPAIVMAFALRKLGETRAKEMLMSGEIINAEKAVNYHLVNKIISSDKLEANTRAFGEKLCKDNSAAALQLTKKMIADMQDFPLENAVQFAARMNAYARLTDDARRGLTALLDKKKMDW